MNINELNNAIFDPQTGEILALFSSISLAEEFTAFLNKKEIREAEEGYIVYEAVHKNDIYSYVEIE